MKVLVEIHMNSHYREELLDLSPREIFYFNKVADKFGLDVWIGGEDGVRIGHLDFKGEAGPYLKWDHEESDVALQEALESYG